MLTPDSRYADLPTATHIEPSGREIAYVTRRFLPAPETLEPRGRTPVADGDRLDQLAARALGDASRWWLLPDANPCLHPTDLVDEPGRLLLVAIER